MEIELEEFVAVKGFKAKGKRIATWEIASTEEMEPTRQPEPEENPENLERLERLEKLENIEKPERLEAPEKTSNSEIPEPTIDESGNIIFTYNSKPDESGQFSLFPDET